MGRIRVEVAGQAWEADLPPQGVTIGREEGCDLRLGDPAVGARQCRVEALPDGRHLVRDLSSGRPTRVNGIDVQQVSLRPGDVIEVGEVRIHYLEAPVEPPVVAVPSAAARAPAAAAPPVPGAAVPAPSPLAPSGVAAAAAATLRPEGPMEAAAPQRARPTREGHRLTGPLVGLLVVAVLAMGAAFLATGGGEDPVAERRAEAALAEGIAALAAGDEDRAIALLGPLAEGPGHARLGKRAARFLRQARENQRAKASSVEADLARLWAERLDVPLEGIGLEREQFVQRHGEASGRRLDGLVQQIAEAQREWLEGEAAGVRHEVAPFLEAGDYARARSAWLGLRRRAPRGVPVGAVVEAALADLDRRAEAELEDLLDRAERAAPFAAVALLERARARYEGTPSLPAVRDALERLRGRTGEVAAGPAPATPAEVPAPAPTPVVPADPPGEAALAGALEAAATAARERRFQQAIEALEAAAAEARARGATPGQVAQAQGRLLDLRLARQGLLALAADIAGRPERYRRVEMTARMVVNLLTADEDGVNAQVTGGTSRMRWATVGGERLGKLVQRMAPRGEAALAAAALLREAGAAAASERWLFAAGQEMAPEALFPVVARWRGEAVPEGGFVPWEERWVTPAEQERLALEKRIREAVQRMHGRDAAQRRAAMEELLGLGASARPALLGALASRRAALVDALMDLKVLTSGSARRRLFEELETRRRHALALIEDAGAWPYPNPGGHNTAEVVSRVEAVRQIWERSAEWLAETDEGLRTHLEQITELDEVFKRVDPSHRGGTVEILAAASARVDVPSYAPGSAGSIRDHSLKVLAYNEKLRTTATYEERENVRAVNDYRMMMGRRAVKIDERLVRGARGHSRHMRLNGYFAHDHGLDPALATPGHRARRQGYGGGVGENIARGTLTGRDAFWAWFGSSGHHRNMLAAGWTEMGAGRSGGTWWTQLFGALTGRSLSLPDALPAPAEDVAPEPEDDRGRPQRPGPVEVPDAPVPGRPPPAEEPDPRDEGE